MTNGFDGALFAGQTVVVTGAGRGIGASVTRAFLRLARRWSPMSAAP